jgi:hypothetical protein
MRPVDLCFLVPGVPADGDAAAEHAPRLAAHHAVTIALCDERPPGAVKPRPGQPRVVALETALADRYDIVIAFDWTAAVHLFSFDSGRHAYYVEAFAHEQTHGAHAQRIVAHLSYDLPVDFLTGAPWVARALAQSRPDARQIAVTRGVARADSDGDAVVIVEGDPLGDVLAGRVVIASSALPGIDDIIDHGINGFLVEPDDDRGAQRFVDLLAGDDAMRERMSAVARATPWPDPDEAAEAMDAALATLVAEPPPDAARWPVRLMADAMASAAVFTTEYAALQTRVDQVSGDDAYRAGVVVRSWWQRIAPAPLRAALSPLLRALRRWL